MQLPDRGGSAARQHGMNLLESLETIHLTEEITHAIHVGNVCGSGRTFAY
jgi:hypothetical protein